MFHYVSTFFKVVSINLQCFFFVLFFLFFFLSQCCAYALLRFRQKKHLVRVRKTLCLWFRIPVLFATVLNGGQGLGCVATIHSLIQAINM